MHAFHGKRGGARLIAADPALRFRQGGLGVAHGGAACRRASSTGSLPKGLLLDIGQNGQRIFILPPPMAGFFEFSLMRLRADLDDMLISRFDEHSLAESPET